MLHEFEDLAKVCHVTLHNSTPKIRIVFPLPLNLNPLQDDAKVEKQLADTAAADGLA